MDASNIAVVAIRPNPRLITGVLPARDFELVTRFIARNCGARSDCRNGTLSTLAFVQRVAELPAGPRAARSWPRYGHHTPIAATSVATLIAKLAAMPGARHSGPNR